MIGFTKQVYEEFPISADFSENMVEAETISACSAAAIDQDTGESASVVGEATQQGQSAVATVTGGESGKTYIVTFQAVTSTGNKWELDIGMRVE